MNKWVQALTLGTTVAVSIAVCTLAGVWIDAVFHVQPAGVLCGLAAGLLCAFAALWRLTKS